MSALYFLVWDPDLNVSSLFPTLRPRLFKVQQQLQYYYLSLWDLLGHQWIKWWLAAVAQDHWLHLPVVYDQQQAWWVEGREGGREGGNYHMTSPYATIVSIQNKKLYNIHHIHCTFPEVWGGDRSLPGDFLPTVGEGLLPRERDLLMFEAEEAEGMLEGAGIRDWGGLLPSITWGETKTCALIKWIPGGGRIPSWDWILRVFSFALKCWEGSWEITTLLSSSSVKPCW